MKFRKKPVEIEAVQWTGHNAPALKHFAGKDIKFVGGIPEIQTLEGRMMVSVNDWVIRGTRGEFYPCKPGPFEDTFEPI